MTAATRSRKSLPSYLHIVEDIYRRVREGEFAPGDTIPSQNALLKQYGVSLITLRKALHVLYSKRVICSLPGKGIFVTERQPDAESRGRIGLAFVGSDFYRSMIKQESIMALQRVLEEQRFELVICGDPVAEVRNSRDAFKGFLLVGEVNREIANAMCRSGMPALVVGEMLDAYCPDAVAQVGGDLEGCVDMAVAYLYELGHDAICLVLKKGARAWRKAADYLQKAAGKYSLMVPPTTVTITTYQNEQNLADTLENLSPLPTALIVTGGQTGSRLVRSLQDAGLRLPADISLLAINTISEEHLLLPDISRVTVNQVDVWKETAATMIRMTETGQAVFKALPPRLTFGATCGDAPAGRSRVQTDDDEGTQSHERGTDRRNY